MSELPIVYPEGLHFTCSRCGDCCRGTTIPLGPGEVERLRALSWSGRVEALAGVEPAERLSSSDRVALRHRPDGACVYLGPENQCLVHEHFGEEVKPLTCRLYPFGFTFVGGRLTVDVAFSCRAVSEDRGAPLGEWLPSWSRLLESARPGEERHPFSDRYAVDGELLWELEQDLSSLLARRELSMLDRIRAVAEFLRLGTTADPTTEAARKLREIMVDGIPRQLAARPLEPELTRLDATQRAVFFHLLFLALNPTPPGLDRQPAKEREREARRRIAAAEGFERKAARPWVDNRELDASFGEVASVALGPLADEAGARLAERFLAAKVLGQRFLREGEKALPFLDAVHRLLVLYPMLLWTARALAAGGGRGKVGLDDARRALRLLDRTHGSIPLADLPSKQRRAWRFVLNETDLAVTASAELLGVDASS